MPLVNIQIGRDRQVRVVSQVETVSDGVAASQILESVQLPLRLIQDSLQSSGAQASSLPVGDAEVFVCACSQRLFSAGEAIGHVEKEHASRKIRRDLDALEATIEALITPSPLPAWSNETLSTKFYSPVLAIELARLFADGGSVTEEHEKRAKTLVEYLGWDKIKGLNYRDYKEQIVLREDISDKKIYKPMHEDFLAAYALLLRQVGGVLKG